MKLYTILLNSLILIAIICDGCTKKYSSVLKGAEICSSIINVYHPYYCDMDFTILQNITLDHVSQLKKAHNRLLHEIETLAKYSDEFQKLLDPFKALSQGGSHSLLSISFWVEAERLVNNFSAVIDEPYTNSSKIPQKKVHFTKDDIIFMKETLKVQLDSFSKYGFLLKTFCEHAWLCAALELNEDVNGTILKCIMRKLLIFFIC
jgi:hypothetical protein